MSPTIFPRRLVTAALTGAVALVAGASALAAAGAPPDALDRQLRNSPVALSGAARTTSGAPPDALDRHLRNSPVDLSGGGRNATGAGGTIRLLDVADKFAFVDAAPTATGPNDLSPGDVLLFDNELRNQAGAQAIGRFVSSCTMTPSLPKALCRGALTLDRGTIHVAALVDFSSDGAVAAVTGGTGRYSNARGQMTVEFGDPSELTLELRP
jgi:hypothetical protein